MSSLDLRQIQGFILRMYRMPMVRHFVLKVNVPAAARALLGRLANGDETDELWFKGREWFQDKAMLHPE